MISVMKKFTYLFSLVLLLMSGFVFTSCDDDAEVAYKLEGVWRGNMYVQHEYNGQTYDAIYSVIEFVRDSYNYDSGYGYWVDYYNGSYWGRNYVANHFDWTVTNGVIKIYFREEHSTIWIENYHLGHRYFNGVIYDGSARVEFELEHTSRPNWDDYYYYGYYAPKQDSAQQAAPALEEQPVRKFRTQQ